MPQLQPNPHDEHAYAIVRYDSAAAEDLPMEVRITVKRIVFDSEFAQAEVERLNELNQDKGCYYFSQVTRVEREPDSRGASVAIKTTESIAATTK